VFWFTYQHVYVLGHDYVAVDAESVVLSNVFQRGFEGATRDGLGRLTQESNPESGTTIYTYDSVAGGYCSLPGSYSSLGDLVAKADQNGNHVCCYYDALHRLTDVGNNNQNTANACKRFR
jgi:hypothetical protein